MNLDVVIQCATPPEFQALHSAFRSPRIEEAGRRRFFRANERCVVLRGAVGKVWAAASAEFAVGRWKPGLVIDFGAAGGLVQELGVGDLVLAEKVIEHDYADAEGGMFLSAEGLDQTLDELKESFVAHSWLKKVPNLPDFFALKDGVRVTRGKIAAGDKDIQSLEDRAELASRVGAVAATWESSAIGRVCRLHDVSYFSLRVITDIGSRSAPGGCATTKMTRDEFLAEYKAGVVKALPKAAQALAELLSV